MQTAQQARTAGCTSTALPDRPAVQVEPLESGENPRDVLQRMLSASFVMQDSSENASVRSSEQPSSFKAPQSPIRAIGWGSCGIVYEELGTTHVIKRAINGNAALADNCRLFNDLFMHKAVEEALHRVEQKQSLAPRFHVPRLYTYMSRNDRPCWSAHARLFAEGDRTPEDLLLSERIPPIHWIARHALIDQYCPGELRAGAKIQDSNKDCLVRLYLGKRRDRNPRITPRRFFGLRNFPLCLDQMQDLGLDAGQYASAMADALAIMHWEAKIDAADVEFVLGGPPCRTHKPVLSLQALQQMKAISPSDIAMSKSEASVTHVWLLDFNQCQAMTMDEQGVDQAVKRFYDNDPYYPRPLASRNEDRALWQTFELRYLEASDCLIDANSRNLPQSFIEKVKEQARTKIETAQRSEEHASLEVQ